MIDGTAEKARLQSRSTLTLPDTKNMDEKTDRISRRVYRWSKAARDLVRANINASGSELSRLVTHLVEESMNPRWACLKFARRMGVRSKRSQRLWTDAEQQRLLKLIDLHQVREVAKLLRRSESSIWHMLYRLGANAKMGKDSFTKWTLATALHVQPQKIQDWIDRGWLKAREVEIGPGKREIIEAEDFCEFCKKHTRDVVGNRLTSERLEFVYHFAFPPSHADLLPVRESKKERQAYEAQSKQEEIQDSSVDLALEDTPDESDAFSDVA
jgi:AraC-like DNA-binding protein